MTGKGRCQLRVCCGRPRLQGVGSASSADLTVSPLSSARKVKLVSQERVDRRAIAGQWWQGLRSLIRESVYMLPGGDAMLWGTTL